MVSMSLNKTDSALELAIILFHYLAKEPLNSHSLAIAETILAL